MSSALQPGNYNPQTFKLTIFEKKWLLKQATLNAFFVHFQPIELVGRNCDEADKILSQINNKLWTSNIAIISISCKLNSAGIFNLFEECESWW